MTLKLTALSETLAPAVSIGVNSKATILSNGRVTDSRPIGAAFYLSGDLRPRFELTKSAMQNIINGVSK